MAIQQPLDMTTRLAPYLPKAFQEGHRPYLFVLAWMAIILVSLLMILDPSESQLIPRLGIVSLIFFEFLMLQFGASEKKASHCCFGWIQRTDYLFESSNGGHFFTQAQLDYVSALSRLLCVG